ncbi:MAG TPA: ATP-binding protein [Casimicrobiaceae bacterium]|jgi:signal transduction histidine kinase/ActR/RegA family two-component response regulator
MSEFRRLLDRLPAGAYMCDTDGLITYFNRLAVRIWGREPKLNDPEDRFCGSFRLYSADGTAITHGECWMALALRERREFNGHEIIVERPDGRRVTVLAHANPVCADTGELLGAVNVLFDITDLKRTESAKDEFLAMLAHELRNPLAPIRNAVHILHLKSPPTPEVTQMLDVIDRQMNHMTRLIDDLLDVSRISRGKVDLRKARLSLTEAVNAALETSRPVLAESGQAFVVAMPDSPIYVDADLTRLAQVISNLLHNAAKYTDATGRIWLTIAQEGGDAVISVRDTGVGIAPDVLPRIFDMFMQADRSIDRARGGLGVGLTVARRLVELHGGSISAGSDGLGKGSTFTVRIPVSAAQATSGPEASLRSGVKNTLASHRILVADDNRDAAESLAALLRMVGHDVRIAYDGVEAVGLADEYHPDTIVLDIGMPKMNGYEVAQKMRAKTWGKDAMIIALSGWGQEDDKRRSHEVGIDHHLVKPLEPASLLELLAKQDNKGVKSAMR